MDVVALPVRHGEGKLIALNDYIRKKIIDLGLNALTYCYEDGTTAVDYPANPNGAELSCAGLSDPSGQVLGLMPHPEAYLSLYNHPNWGKIKRLGAVVSEEGEGLGFFRNLVKAVAKKKTSIHS
jgi:phosphoribosylformylglycinamidine synthase